MALPSYFSVGLNPHTRVIDDGAALVGGSPTRYIRLSKKAQQGLHGRRVSAATEVGAQLADKLLSLAMADPVIDELPDVDEEYTVVIPVHDRLPQLDRLLRSVRESTAPAHPRIIVVDDHSSDAAAIELVAHQHDAEVLRLDSNRGPAGARNAGLAQVTTDFVVFLDSDLVINTDSIPTLLKHFADPQLAVAAPRVTSLGTDGSWIDQYERVHSALDLGPRPAAIRPRSMMSWVPSAALAARTAALGAGFDESMRVGEDVDLVWRLTKAGWRVRYEPSARVAHEHRTSFRSWLRRKYDYGTSAAPLAERHPEAMPPAILAPWGVGVVVSLLIQRKWSLVLAAAIAGWAASRSATQVGSAAHPVALGVVLTARGLTSACTQTSALILRHWWPITLIGCLFSRRIRRAASAVALIDIAVDYVRRKPRIDPVRYGIARRLDDVAYGAGVWVASLKSGTFAALKPEISRSENRTPR